MFQGRHQGPGPNFVRPTGPFMQPQRPDHQRMPQSYHPFSQQMPKPQEMGHPFRSNGPIQQPSQKGGLLGKLFNKSKQTPKNLFAPPAGVKQETRSGGSGILETLKNPQGLNTMLNNTQRVLQAAEQFTPMIQQYAPIVKNLPSMWKIMRAFNSDDSKQEETKKEETIKKSPMKKRQDASDAPAEKKTKQRSKKKKRDSVPKLYV
jgi:hypothetical protein